MAESIVIRWFLESCVRCQGAQFAAGQVKPGGLPRRQIDSHCAVLQRHLGLSYRSTSFSSFPLDVSFLPWGSFR